MPWLNRRTARCWFTPPTSRDHRAAATRILRGEPFLIPLRRGLGKAGFNGEFASHALDGVDAEQVQTLLQHAGRQIAQQQPALFERVRLGTQDRAVLIEAAESF